MAFVIADRVREEVSVSGTNDVTLSGAVDGFQTFSAVLSDGDTTYYTIVDNDTDDFEVGIATFTSGTNSIARDTVLSSSNSGSLVSFSGSNQEAFITYPASKAVFEDPNDNVTLPADLSVDTDTLYVDSSNDRVGIGTSSPSEALDVVGDIKTNGRIKSSTVTSYDVVNGDNSTFFDLDCTEVSTADARVRIFRNTNTSGTKQFQIYRGDGTSTADAQIGIDGENSFFNSGNVGIGTDSPSEKLQVAGNILLEDSELIFNSDAGAIVKIDNLSGDLRLHSDASILFFETDLNAVKGRIDVNNGRIRIGDEAVPSEALEVVGNVVPSADATHDLGTPSLSWNNIYTNDLHLSNMKHDKGNDVDGTKGTWTIQEGEDDLFIINNRNGKKYKFALEEIE